MGRLCAGVGGRRLCHKTGLSASILAVASGIICNGGAKAAPGNHRGKGPFSPNTGPTCNTRRGNTLTSLLSMTGVPCGCTASNVSGAFTIAPSALNRSRRAYSGALMGVVGKCVGGGNRRLGVGIFGHSALVSTRGRPRGCPALAVHISKCYMCFTSLAGRRRSSMVSEAFRSRVWRYVLWLGIT